MDVTRTSPILYVITKGTWGGAQRYVFELALEAHARGASVLVATGTPGELVRRLEDAQVPVVLIPGLARDIRLGSDLRALVALIRLMRRIRPQVVHSNSSKAGLIAGIAARLSLVPHIVFTAHGWAWNELRPNWQKTAFKVLHLTTVYTAHSVIAVSEAIAAQAAWMPLAQRKFEVIRHGVPPLALVPRAESRLFLEHTLNTTLPAQGVWIGALAELHPTKGLDVLIRAFARIASTFPETVLILIGAGEDRGRLVALAHMHQIETRVFFTGHIQDAARILPALDVFAFPSHSEALGYAALEAGQAALPVIASNVGGIPEIIEDGSTGLLVPAGDEVLLAEGLTALLADPALREQLGTALHTKVLTSFTMEQMFSKTFGLY